MPKETLVYYPERTDPDFYEKVYQKAEFYKNRIRPDTYEGKTTEELCIPKERYKLQPNQKFAKNFMSPETPYDSLFLWLGTGVGKCVTPETEVLIANTGSTTFSYRQIENVWFENAKNGEKMAKDEEGGLWVELGKNSIRCISYDETAQCFTEGKITKLYRQAIKEKVKTVVLEDGTFFKLTFAHKLYTLKAGWTNNFDDNDLVLAAGESLTSSPVLKRIVTILSQDYSGFVYDFEVEKYHNYLGQVLFHNTCTAVTIAENFKKQFQTLYENKQEGYIYIIAQKEPQQLFIKELTGDCGTLANNLSLDDENPYLSREQKKELLELSRLRSKAGIEKFKKAWREYVKYKLEKPSRGGFYRFRSYSKFTIDVAAGKVKNIDNSVLIIDEAHNLLNQNDWQQAVEKMIKVSKNVRVILLSATPMINKPSQIVDFLNLIVQPGIKKSDVFISDTEFKKGGLEILQDRAKGYISYIRGKNPYTFPSRIEVGETPTAVYKEPKTGITFGIKYTKVIRCPMSEVHYRTYKEYWQGAMRQELKQLMDMVFPDPDHQGLGVFSERDLLRDVLPKAKSSFLEKHQIELIPDTSAKRAGGKIQLQISGDILKEENLKNWSTKYYMALKLLNSFVGLDNGHVYINSKFVHGIGIKLFGQILQKNGYDEFNPYSPDAGPSHPGVRCYLCGIPFNKHNGKKDHDYASAKYSLLHSDNTSEERNKILEFYNLYENKGCKYLKILMAAGIGKESIDLKRVTRVFLLNYQENFSKTEQVIGRAERFCSHKDLPPEQRKVWIYKFVCTLPGKLGDRELSAEEIEYSKDEHNFIMMKHIERALKVAAIDCAFNKPGNVFLRDMQNNKGCIKPEDAKPGDKRKICSPLCDFTDCHYKCLYEPKGPGGQDKSTYGILYHNEEVSNAMNYIRGLFSNDIVWSYENIIDRFRKEQDFEFLEDKYIILALDRLIKEKVSVKNPFGIHGYVVYKNKYYVFQPQNIKDTNISVNERMVKTKDKKKDTISVSEYVKRLAIENARLSTVDTKKILQLLEREQSKKKISKTLNRLSIEEQKGILEGAIADYYKAVSSRQYPTNAVIKILRNYKDILITKEQLEDASDYSSTRDDDFEAQRFTEQAGVKLFVGHVLMDQPRCFNGREWSECGRAIDLQFKVAVPNEKENDVVIGFIDKDAHGRMVFKLRKVQKGEVITDRRKLRKGFQCGQTNDKKGLVKICEGLGVNKNQVSNKKIQDICVVIEDTLRSKQRKSRENKEGIRYFYEYVDLMRLHKK